ncbi:hypothetical protein ACFLSV_01955 [Bacteroidota bacterium]
MKVKVLIIFTILISSVFFTHLVFAKPDAFIIENSKQSFKIKSQQYLPYVIIQQVTFDPNRMSTYIYNKGIFNQDLSLSNTPGLEWPKGSHKFACFTSGLCIAAKVNGELREAMASYAGEYAEGYIGGIGGPALRDSRFRVYKVQEGDDASNNLDYAQWGNMVPFGAPYIDKNENGQYDPGIDLPGIKDAKQTIFACLTDGFPEEHSLGEGFGGGTPPMFAEVHLTAWGYDGAVLEDVQFFEFVIINKNQYAWDSTFMAIVSDPDLGWALDDYIGCDSSLNMSYCYNADNNDDITQYIYAYGINPPAFGMSLFKSPMNYSVSPSDILGATACVYMGRNSGPPCESDPNGEPVSAYNMLQGIKKDRTPWYNPLTGLRTKFCYPGDPESGIGWTEFKGSITNCGGDSITPNNTILVNAPGDRRMILSTGGYDLKVNPGDTQEIVLAQFVARGSSNLNSVTKLKSLDKKAQRIFDLEFDIIPTIVQPQVNISYKDKGEGRVNIVLSWDNRSEGYLFWDTVFSDREDSGFYKFEGYEIYEIRRTATDIPILNKPETITNDITCLRIFDIVDTVGIIFDTLSGGLTNGVFQVVPPYKSRKPPGFPNTGLIRSLELTGTMYPVENGGDTNFIFGHEYKFAVMAYAYNSNPMRGQAITRNSLLTSIITVRPEAPLAGTQYNLELSDTINTNRRDLGVVPIVISPELLINAKYKILFGNPDTTYNLLRSINNGLSFDTLYRNLLPVQSTADDSSKIVNGVLIKAQRITEFNEGVIKDPILPTDSIQTRYRGWEYTPENHRYLTASDTLFVSTKPYQSQSMNLSWPNQNTFTGNGTSVTPERLRRIKIVYTGYGNGQMAYRYLRNVAPFPGQDPKHPSFIPWVIHRGIGFPYQQLNEVPFKVYEIDQDDSTTGYRQVNCVFLENNDSLFSWSEKYLGRGEINGKWDPTTHMSGGFEVLYIMESNYDTNKVDYKMKNLMTQQSQFDIMYVWAPKADTSSHGDFTVGDEFTIYPYTVTVPFIAPGYPLYYEFSTPKAIIGSTQLASSRGDMDKIRVVPNPYYGYNQNQSSISDRFVKFRRLPKKCNIKIYSLNGDMVRQLDKDNEDPTLKWNLRNLENNPVASGMYIVLINAEGIGQKIIKLAVFTTTD